MRETGTEIAEAASMAAVHEIAGVLTFGWIG